MKKVIALVICAVMVLSMIPAVTLSVSAAVEGDWDTYRRPSDYNEPPEGQLPSYTPAPGYVYTSEGFQTINANYTECNPFFTVQTKDKQSLKDGIHMDFRIDEFSYGGETGIIDHWICLSLWDSVNISPGSTSFGSGWLCLIRGEGQGAGTSVESWITTASDPEAGVSGTFAYGGPVTNVQPRVDNEGHELFTLDVTWTGSAYEIKVNGTLMGGSTTAVTEFLEGLDPAGDFYVGLTMYTGVRGGVAGLSVLKYNGSVPAGSDSKPVEENYNRPPAPLEASDTIPVNMPCLMFDATKTSFSVDPKGSNMEMIAQGDDSYHCVAATEDVYYTWSMSRSLSYAADDFPVVAVMLRNYNGDSGRIWYCAGDVFNPQVDCIEPWSGYSDDNRYYDMGDDVYTLVLVDLSFKWFDRIHNVRVDFTCADVNDPELAEWDIMWMGCFRSEEEACAYADARMDTLKASATETGDETADPSGQETVAPVESTAPETVPATQPATDAVTEAPTDAAHVTATGEIATETAGTSGGCASVMSGAMAVLLAALTAGVALKKKH